MSNLVSLIESSPYFKEKFRRVDNFEYDYLTANDLDGVDCNVEFEIDELKIDAPREEIAAALEEILSDDGIFFNKQQNIISSSSSDEIWVLGEGSRRDGSLLKLPEGAWKVHRELKRFEDGGYDDFYTALLIEDFVLRSGYFPGVYFQDYYGNVSEYKIDPSFMEVFPQDNKLRQAMVNDLLCVYKVMQELEEGYRADMSDLPEMIINNLPNRYKEDDIALVSVKDIFPTHVLIEVEYENEEEDLITEVLDIPTIENSIRFIMGA